MKDAPRYDRNINISREIEDFIKKLLVKDPSKRLGGTKSGFNSVVNHPWFRHYDWINLERKTFKNVPFIPDVEDDSDVSNFCEVPEAEIESVMVSEEVEEDRIFDAILDQD